MEHRDGFTETFIDDDEAYFEGLDEQDENQEEVQEDSSDIGSEDTSEDTPLEYSDLAKFLHFELEMREFNRKILKFTLHSEKGKTVYTGRPVKECDGGKFIFILTKPESRLKKFDVSDMELK